MDLLKFELLDAEGFQNDDAAGLERIQHGLVHARPVRIEEMNIERRNDIVALARPVPIEKVRHLGSDLNAARFRKRLRLASNSKTSLFIGGTGHFGF